MGLHQDFYTICLNGIALLLILFVAFMLLHVLLGKGALEFHAHRKAIATDLLYYSFSVMAVTPCLYYALQYLFHLPPLTSAVQAAPYWLQLLGCLYVVDTVFYWQHRLFHHRYLWSFHAVHHSSNHVGWLSNIRSSVVDNFIHSLAITAIPYFLGFPIEVVLMATMINYLYSYYIHANIPLSYGPLRYVLVSPAHHRWHHARHLHGGNYSGIFAFNDLLFRSYKQPEHPVPLGLGEEYPSGFFKQQTKAWRDFISELRRR